MQPSGTQPSEAWHWRITLADSDPPIWRRVAVPGAIALADFHIVIQAAMGWPPSLSYRFRQGGHPATLNPDLAPDITLARLGLVPGAKLAYTYDLQDGWLHSLDLEAIEPGESLTLPCCLAGERACPPPGCGGMWGYEELLERLWDPDDPDCEALLASVGYDFDPDYFDEAAAVQRVAALQGAISVATDPGAG
jgi:hypothetical protein